MRKKVALIGVVILVVGVAMFFGSSYGIKGLITTSTHMTEQSSGLWVSNEINASSSSELTVVSGASSFALIPSSDLSVVNSGNLQSYAVKSADSLNTSAGHVSVYSPGSGSYYVVAVSQAAPSVSYVYESSASTAVLLGIVTLVGIILSIAGVIVLIIGLVLRNKNKNGLAQGVQ